MKRIIALLLAGLMALSIAACGPANDPDDSTDDTKKPAESTTDSSAEDTTTELSYYEQISSNKFDGEVYDWIANSDADFPKDFENSDSDPSEVDQAIAKRFEVVSEQYGVKFNFVVSGGSGASVDMINQDFMSGLNSYDVGTGSYVYLAGPLVKNGLVMSVEDIGTVDLTKDWWASQCQTELAIAGNTFYVTGPIVKCYFEDTAALYFNKDLMESFNVEEDIYQLVKDGKWTFDKMTEIASVVGTHSETGYWQFISSDIVGYNFYFGAGLKITNYDDNGIPYLLDAPSEQMIAVADKYADFFSQQDKVVNPTLDWYLSITRTDEEKADREFKHGKAMFYGQTTGDAIKLRDSDVNFGIVPTPTYTEGSNYVGYTNVWGAGSFNFMRAQANKEMTGVITEALAYASYEYLKPALYDKMLMGRSVMDEESGPMLDLVFQNKSFDMCDVMEWGNMNYNVRDAILGGKASLASDWAEDIAAAKASLQDTINYYQGIFDTAE